MPTLATVGILSIGQMGLGVAELLVASNYAVLTNVSDRSAATQKRAHDASLVLVDSDVDLVAKSDYIISIVPPRDAVATADRIANALQRSPRQSPSPLYYLDLNAIAPSTAARIASAFAHQNVRFIDGGIIGGPPTRSPDGWSKPGIPLSGPHTLSSAPASGAHVASVLNTRHVDARIGRASGLKCCFAALTKGMTALALQSYTTASALDVLPHLQHYMDMHNPSVRARAEKSIVACPGKAYRWVEEMRQIGECFAVEGGWAEQARVFREIAGVYEGLAAVVEMNGGAEGMGDVEGAVRVLREALEGRAGGGRASVQELEQEDR